MIVILAVLTNLGVYLFSGLASPLEWLVVLVPPLVPAVLFWVCAQRCLKRQVR